jgi:hypothetical protein
MAKIGIDVDDVCSDFQKRFVQLLHATYGRPPLGTAPIDWDWSNCQVSPSEMSNAWKLAANTPDLWLNLDPLDSFDEETVTLLQRAFLQHDVFFITNRFATPGASPLKQTKTWFYYKAGILTPNVIIAKDKGPAAQVLELDYFIDDRPKNCTDVFAARPSTLVYLADSSHNQEFNDPFIPRVANLKEFLKLVLEAN